MNSWLIITILTILLLVCIGMLMMFHWDIRRMTKQLENIIKHFGTNELVRTNTHNQTMNRFIIKINQLIHLFKKDQQDAHRKEKKLKQEITNISHDLRTPLTSIKGFSELLTDSSLSETERKDFLDIIQKKIDNLTMTVDLFYELSQIDSLDNKLTMEKLLLDQMVVELMLMFYDDFSKNELNIQVNESSVSPIFANQKATNRIIINMIQNALRYAKSYLTITLIEKESYVQLSAINDVSEFDHAEVDRVFDRTFRSDSSRTSGQLGLGLHIIKQLIQKQGGKVVADVQENEFRIDVFFRKWG